MTPAGRPIDVLLVEDDPGDELITREAFEHNKIKNNLHVAHDGEEGLDFLYKRGAFEDAPTPDLILLDLNLPGKDGREVLAEVKNDDELKQIPVVVLSASPADEDVEDAYARHANAYVRKPANLDEFVDCMKLLEAFWLSMVRLPPTP
jgi:CheY-like chemotaxis protein